MAKNNFLIETFITDKNKSLDTVKNKSDFYMGKFA